MSRGWIRTCFGKGARGFLLIELLVGLSIFMIVVLGASGYIYQLAKVHVEGKNRMRAITLARSAMAQLVAGKSHSIVQQQDQFRIEWQLVPDPQSQFSRAHVCVSWVEVAGALQSVSLDSGVSYAYA